MIASRSHCAVFLDRDGTINRDVCYLNHPRQLVLLPGVAAAIRELNRHHWLVIVITNQSGIGRGYFTPPQLHAVHDALQVLLAAQGARLDGIYYCPHKPEAGCSCRKPAAGLLQRAAADFQIDLHASYMIGDKESDLRAGRQAGCRTVLVLTGQEQASTWADFVAPHLPAAIDWIKSNGKRR